jgi:uncharacterized protein involved in exopolysaccharide biosynthesis/Mrp family chromosome partitioning ATPase
MTFGVEEFSQSMQPPSRDAKPEDIDVAALGRALWRAKTWIISLSILAGLVTFVGLSMVRPLYTSEARILIENDVSPFTRTATDQGRDQLQVLDEQAVQSQVQVITSRDLVLEVVRSLDLTNNPEFAKDAGVSYFQRLLNRFGLGRGSPKSEQEKAADAFLEHLSVYALNKSSVIAVDYTSGDSDLAAKAANRLADVYIEWQRTAKVDQTKDATLWLNNQIEELRKKTAESESAVEQFRSSQGLFEGSNKVTLNAQQLSELNSQLILAKAQQSEAEARARLIKQMLDTKGDIDATPEVLKSELIGRLIEQRVQVQRQIAELSATLLPSHPRMKQLNAELADVRTQTRAEVSKIVKGLENEAQVAGARETSLRNSLNEAKSHSAGQGDAEIKLRALEREAKANRDLLESYLARYQDASARHEMGAVPANASIVSRAHASTTPSFPKRVQLTLLVMAATMLLSLAYVLSRELIGAGAKPLRSRKAAKSEGDEPEPITIRAASATPEREAAPPIYQSRRRTQDSGRRAQDRAEADIMTDEGPIRPPTRRRATDRLNLDKTEDAPMRDIGRIARSLTSTTTPAPPQDNFIERLRRIQLSTPNTPPAEMKPAPVQPAAATPTRPDEETATQPKEATEAQPNDLRRYLQQRAASSKPDLSDLPPRPADREPQTRGGRVAPVVCSLDALVNQIFAEHISNKQRLVLIAATSPKANAAPTTIEIARLLAANAERAVLVDLTRGSTAISGPLGVPRAPGFSDLLAGSAGFEEVVRVDAKSALQVIVAGTAKPKSDGNEAERSVRIFSALAQAYDLVVLYGDQESVARFQAALQGRLAMAIAVLAGGGDLTTAMTSIAELTAFGAPVFPYDKSADEERPGIFGRIAAS